MVLFQGNLRCFGKKWNMLRNTRFCAIFWAKIFICAILYAFSISVAVSTAKSKPQISTKCLLNVNMVEVMMNDERWWNFETTFVKKKYKIMWEFFPKSGISFFFPLNICAIFCTTYWQRAHRGWKGRRGRREKRGEGAFCNYGEIWTASKILNIFCQKIATIICGARNTVNVYANICGEIIIPTVRVLIFKLNISPSPSEQCSLNMLVLCNTDFI